MTQASQIKEIESIAATDATQINKFLADHGFSIRINNLRPSEFGVAAILDLLVKWQVPGTSVQITGPEQKEYPGVQIKKGVKFLTANSKQHNVLAKISTQSADEVYLATMDWAPSGLDLVAYAKDLITGCQDNHDYDKVEFPMVDFHYQPEISWLIGMSTTDSKGVRSVISQAKQETKLRLNEIGARVQDAVAMATLRAVVAPKKTLVIDKPFLCIFARSGLEFPLAVFHLKPNSWKDPGKLS